MKSIQLETAIIATLAYADIFNQALTTAELAKYLYGYTLKSPRELTQAKSTATRFKFQDGYWVLATREELLQRKPAQVLRTETKIQQVKKYLVLFRLLPWIKFVGITGSVAGGTPAITDDIDLVIITSPQRLWLTRLILILLLNLVGKRRKPNDNPQQVNNKFCLNMWLSIENLSENHSDLYTANELARIVPVLNRNRTHERYLQTNSWLKSYLPNFWSQLPKSKLSNPQPSTFNLLNPVDRLAERLQRKIMKRPTIETVEPKRLAFHPHDYRSEILQRYQQRLRELGVSDWWL